MILVTGGAGYLGSHTVLELLKAGYPLVVVDNLCNSSLESLQRVQRLSGKTLAFVQADIRDQAALRAVFERFRPTSVMHFAGLKAVGESVAKPLSYYDNNLAGSLSLLQVMQQYSVKAIIFSSSATVYGDPDTVPIQEHFAVGNTNSPYATSKYMVERVIADVCAADPAWKAVCLRYFNPAGADESGLIGEDPDDIPNNLLPYIAQVAVGRLPYLQVFGDDYNTVDGTGVRDYVHVSDIALGHVAALQKLDSLSGCETINLGSGTYYSVLQVIEVFQRVTGVQIPYSMVARRDGDVAQYYTDTAKARELLGWSARFDLQQIVNDTWRWQSKNPFGYHSK